MSEHNSSLSSASVPKKIYKDPKLYRGKGNTSSEYMSQQWFIFYSVWDFENEKWKPQKFYGSLINNKALHGGSFTKRMEYATKELETVRSSLKDGLNPKDDKTPLRPVITQEELESHAGVIIPNYHQAKEVFLKAYQHSVNNKKQTYPTFKSILGIFEKFIVDKKLDKQPINKIKTSHVYEFMDGKYNTFIKDEKKGGYKRFWGEQTYNNNFGFIRTFFQFFVKRKILNENPCASFAKKDVLEVERFDAFPIEVAKDILSKLDREDPYLALICRFVYYSLIRPGSELPRLKLKHIAVNDDGHRVIKTPMNISKTKVDSEVDLDDELWVYLEPYIKQVKYDGELYLFGADGKPSSKEISRYVVSKKFTRYLIKWGYTYEKTGKNYSIYSFKHTGAVMCKHAGWDTFDIMRKCRHKSETETLKYLRSIGVAISLKSRPKRISI